MVAGGLGLSTPAGPYFQGLLPHGFDLAVAGLLWIWFINLFNFMDGIDGIAGGETAAIAVGVGSVAALGGSAVDTVLGAATVAGAAVGFLWWNRHPARIFLGDVGSAPLGFLLGWMLLDLAARGLWAPALILPLYYLADATVTIVRRALRGERVWHPHRQHYYQQAVRRGLSHTAVVGAVVLADAALIGLALAAAAGWPWPALGGACVVVLVLLRHLGNRRPDGGTAQ